jgi:hypothetical protein
MMKNICQLRFYRSSLFFLESHHQCKKFHKIERDGHHSKDHDALFNHEIYLSKFLAALRFSPPSNQNLLYNTLLELFQYDQSKAYIHFFPSNIKQLYEKLSNLYLKGQWNLQNLRILHSQLLQVYLSVRHDYDKEIPYFYWSLVIRRPYSPYLKIIIPLFYN